MKVVIVMEGVTGKDMGYPVGKCMEETNHIY